uniref:Uncharacterized protein n=1 Tax=Arundo donax TaxID=35708 RepID=A0A0A8ZV31_ARUDO
MGFSNLKLLLHCTVLL